MTKPTFKPGQKVKAHNVRGKPVNGTFVAVHNTIKGDWYEITPADGGKNFRTRPAFVAPA